MRNIVIIADSTCDLSLDLIKKYDIKIVPLHVSFKGDTTDYLDGVTISREEVYKKVEELGVTPTTGARNVAELINDFKTYVDQGFDVIFTGIGSGLSSTYSNAMIARSEVSEEHIEVVDSQNLSTGTGLLVLKMAKFRDEGLDVHEIALKVKELVSKVSAKFCIDKLDYLYKGGRCSGLSKALANVFKIHPVAKVINNKLTVYRMPRGKYIKAVDEQLNEFKKDFDNIDISCVFITHSGHLDNEDKYMFEYVARYVPIENIHITEAGCVVSSHCGPKTIGILYLLK